MLFTASPEKGKDTTLKRPQEKKRTHVVQEVLTFLLRVILNCTAAGDLDLMIVNVFMFCHHNEILYPENGEEGNSLILKENNAWEMNLRWDADEGIFQDMMRRVEMRFGATFPLIWEWECIWFEEMVLVRFGRSTYLLYRGVLVLDLHVFHHHSFFLLCVSFLTHTLHSVDDFCTHLRGKSHDDDHQDDLVARKKKKWWLGIELNVPSGRESIFLILSVCPSITISFLHTLS